jgi:4,5-DOPA dioxygenase extradiol
MSEKMPTIFIGHGSPMNAIENNSYTAMWTQIAKQMKRPEGILSISAHWFTHGTKITDAPRPKVIYDMYDFPEALYRVAYQPPGDMELAHETIKLISRQVTVDNTWGIDHGTWSVLCRMYPEADIPVYQMSVDADADAETQFEIGKEIKELRNRGVMILGSGNVVHNLSRVNWDMESGYPWAQEFDSYIKNGVIERNYKDVIDYKKAGSSAEMAFYTPDHFAPLLYVLGASQENDRLTVFNDSCTMGALSMTCYLFE